jgi:FixJ family two-component response regulator
MKSGPVPAVFIIDDDRGMRQAIHDLVECVGLRAKSFATGEEFLGTEHADRPCCLVLDARLPHMSGLDFQRRLAETGLQIPVIFVTAHGDIPMSCQSAKVRCCGIFDKTLPAPGFAGCNSAGARA